MLKYLSIMISNTSWNTHQSLASFSTALVQFIFKNKKLTNKLILTICI